MTIKDNKNKYALIKNRLKKIYISDFFILVKIWSAIIVPILIISVIFIKLDFFKKTNFRENALNLVRNDYPTLICLSPQGAIRIYHTKTYEIFNDPVNGWQIYDKKQGHIPSSTFHLSRCELK